MNTRIVGSSVRPCLLLGVLFSLSLVSALGQVPAPACVTNVVTFDDLADQTVIPNGYGQLDWSGFETITAIGDGYTAGLISPPNAAFNPFGYDASISNGQPFNLVSAYLTAGVVPTMQLQVEGWAGANLVYDQTCTLNESSPTLVIFNYSGVTEVTFIGADGEPFVMDNLMVSSPSFTNVPAPAPPTPPTNTSPSATNVVTFDDLPDMTVITNGYEDLDWSGFEVISWNDLFFGAGYENGLISPPNVAFNPFGYNASLSSSQPFDLISAYLTGAVLPGLRVEVEGFVGTILTYDQSYTVSESGPTFVTFDYSGVTHVTFIPEPMSQFVMDNLTVSSPAFTNLPVPAPPTNAPPANTNSMVELGQVEVSTIGHLFYQMHLPLLGNQVLDFLVDQS